MFVEFGELVNRNTAIFTYDKAGGLDPRCNSIITAVAAYDRCRYATTLPPAVLTTFAMVGYPAYDGPNNADTGCYWTPTMLRVAVADDRMADNPVNRLDPTGLSDRPAWENLGSIDGSLAGGQLTLTNRAEFISSVDPSIHIVKYKATHSEEMLAPVGHSPTEVLPLIYKVIDLFENFVPIAGYDWAKSIYGATVSDLNHVHEVWESTITASQYYYYRYCPGTKKPKLLAVTHDKPQLALVNIDNQQNLQFDHENDDQIQDTITDIIKELIEDLGKTPED